MQKCQRRAAICDEDEMRLHSSRSASLILLMNIEPRLVAISKEGAGLPVAALAKNEWPLLVRCLPAV